MSHSASVLLAEATARLDFDKMLTATQVLGTINQSDGIIAMQIAAANGREDVCMALHELKGVSLSSALDGAAITGQSDLLFKLLEHPTINPHNDLPEALRILVWHGHTDLVENVLTKYPILIDKFVVYQIKTLREQVQRQIAIILLNHGADPKHLPKGWWKKMTKSNTPSNKTGPELARLIVAKQVLAELLDENS